jgi:hypothetical protein
MRKKNSLTQNRRRILRGMSRIEKKKKLLENFKLFSKRLQLKFYTNKDFFFILDEKQKKKRKKLNQSLII